MQNTIKKAPVALIILDGFGQGEISQYNAVHLSGTPHINKLKAQYPHSTLVTSGQAVGLPKGLMGNSEVGHLNIGAGRVVYQDISMIDKSIQDGDFFNNTVLLATMDNCIKHNSALHVCGLMSDGGVHSSMEHCFAILELAKKKGLKKVWVHAFMDGRDTAPKSGVLYLNWLIDELATKQVGKIATVVGRYYIMDRDNRWDRVKAGYDAVFDGIGIKVDNAADALINARAKGYTDEFVEASVVGDYQGVNPQDSMILFNFRADRARELSRVAVDKDFNEFKRIKGFKPIFYVGITEYDNKLKGVHTVFPPKNLKNTLGEWLSKNGITQTRVAETEKYAHVTFFFNGGVEEPNKGETRVLVPSPKVATYDLQPQMSAIEVTNECIKALDNNTNVLIVNYANCDMVGHTGELSATVDAVNCVDACVDRIVNKILDMGGSCIITADHGNAEQMAYSDGSKMTSHTTNDVLVLVVGKDYLGKPIKSGALKDIAPTLLKMMEVQKPKEMEGESLV